MTQINATEFFKENKTDGMKSPGAWLQLKDTKSQLKTLECEKPSKDENGDWQFDADLFSIYKYYLLLEQEESKTEDKTDMQNDKQDWQQELKAQFEQDLNEEITEYIEKKFYERATGLNYAVMNKMGVKDRWEEANENLKTSLSAVRAMALAKFRNYNRRIDTYLLDDFLSTFTDLMTKQYTQANDVLFENDAVKICYDARGRLKKVDK